MGYEVLANSCQQGLNMETQHVERFLAQTYMTPSTMNKDFNLGCQYTIKVERRTSLALPTIDSLGDISNISVETMRTPLRPDHVKATPWGTPARNPASQRITHPPAGRPETAVQGRKEYAGLRLLAKELATRRPKIKISPGPPCRTPTRPASMPRQTPLPISTVTLAAPLPPLDLAQIPFPFAPTYHASNPLSPRTATTSPSPVTTQPPGDTWSTDRLIQAWRQGGERSPALQAALRALRPSDRPTGRFRVRLQGSNGTVQKIWLPPVD
ncbi:hypothetical protein JTB14_021964 [Gonioctena quinquepunctata]|nr:hypothetical protein JTB14_021964 [Gonioctena quinquepunctata]